ncbi:MAG: hypothetical protein WAX77_09795 [Methylococcaceae bacterium]
MNFKKIISWLLFLLLCIEGIYFEILLSRTDYGKHGSNIGCDTLFLMYALCLTTLSVSLILFYKNNLKSYFYTAYFIISFLILITLSLLHTTGLIIGIDGSSEGIRHIFCPVH